MSTKNAEVVSFEALRALAVREKCPHVVAAIDCECIDDLTEACRDEAIRECDGLVCDLEPNDEAMARTIDAFIDRLTC